MNTQDFDITTSVEISGRTMIARRGISAPTKFLTGQYSPVTVWDGADVLHHGAGRAQLDSAAFRRAGACCREYDPNSPLRQSRVRPAVASFDFTVSNYVLNTLPVLAREMVRDEILEFAPCAFISVRADFGGINGEHFDDGFLTSRGTFQRAYGNVEFREFLNESDHARRVDIVESNRNFVMARVFTAISGIPDQRY